MDLEAVCALQFCGIPACGGETLDEGGGRAVGNNSTRTHCRRQIVTAVQCLRRAVADCKEGRIENTRQLLLAVLPGMLTERPVEKASSDGTLRVFTFVSSASASNTRSTRRCRISLRDGLRRGKADIEFHCVFNHVQDCHADIHTFGRPRGAARQLPCSTMKSCCWMRSV